MKNKKQLISAYSIELENIIISETDHFEKNIAMFAAKDKLENDLDLLKSLWGSR